MPPTPEWAVAGGESWPIPEWPVRLIDWLRDGLGRTAPKEGCGAGHCGACTVLLGDRPVLACCALAQSAAGSTVMTAEEIVTTELGARLADAFVAAGAMQCGFCTPGMLTIAYALLMDPPADLGEDQVKQAMIGNLCRCTGYVPIIEAIMQMASERTEGPGHSRIRQT